MVKRISLPAVLEFDWDEGNLGHIKKHQVEQSECEEAFFNKPFLIDKDIAHSQKEERFEALGQTNKGRMLFTVFTIRRGKARVISARTQNRKERKIYLGGEVNES